MDPAFLPPCVTQLNGSSMVRARRYSACRSSHENWQKRGIPGTLIFLAFSCSCSRSPPAADCALAVNYQFWQPTLPCWLRTSFERVDCSGHTTTRRLPYWANRALLPELEQVVPIYSLSVAVWLTARHWPDTRLWDLVLIIFHLLFFASGKKIVKMTRKKLKIGNIR